MDWEKKYWEKYNACEALIKRAEKAEKENKQLKEYARHKKDCAIISAVRIEGFQNKCTCGLNTLLGDE